MLMDIEIKEEPLEESEILEQQLKQETTFIHHHNGHKQQALWQKHLQMQLLEDSEEMSDDQFHIVEEHEDVITVSAGDLKTQDELQFIEKLQDPQKQLISCPKCLNVFKNLNMLESHVKRNKCLAKQKCSVCPLTFIDTPSLLSHLKLHRDNYFFCSQYCGASFRNLPLCEDHERNEHKTNNPFRIRYKHFCSFCREGFKTEIQLHVHWLQQQSPCGKIMQDVVLHSNNSITNYDDNDYSKTTNKVNDSITIPQVSVPTNACSIFPLTQLRLKSNVSPPRKGNKAKKRQESPPQHTQNVQPDTKRMKVVENLKAKMIQSPEEMLIDFPTDIQIKDEPLDDYDVLNTSPPSLMPEVIIKTEEDLNEYSTIEETSSMELKSLLINNNKFMNPDFNGKIIPLMASPTVDTVPPLKMLTPPKNNNANMINNNFNLNTSLKNITNLKLVRITPASIASSTRQPFNAQLRTEVPGTETKITKQNSREAPSQLIKLLPNTQLLSFKTTQDSNVDNNKSQPVIMQFQGYQPNTSKPTQQISLTITPITPKKSVAAGTSLIKTRPELPTPSEGVLQLNKMLANNTIDSEDFKKLQSEAFRKAEELRKKYISKKNLNAIDSLPEKKQLIANLKQQIAQVETSGDSSLVHNNNNDHDTDAEAEIKASVLMSNGVFKREGEGIILNVKNSNEPPILYLPILSAVDVELVKARYQYPEYTYKWICPYCLKDYEIKRCLKSHLIKAHNLTNRDMEKINAQAKPFLNATEITMEQQSSIQHEPEEILSDAVTSESESILSVQTSTDTEQQQQLQQQMTSPPSTVSPEPIKMSALKMNKQRYVCNICGRQCSSKTMLNDHMKANCSREPQYPCKECPKKFYSESTLRCHVTIHTGELPHKCNYCEKRFRTRGQVTVHHRTHTGERPFVCQVCCQRFTHRETLIAHLSRHIGMKRYKCYCCDKHFSCISALKTHREIRPDTCGKVKFNPRAIGPRVRVVRGTVIFEAQPEINPYLKSEDPKNVLAELQNPTEENEN